MQSSEQITVGALAIKETTTYGGFFDSPHFWSLVTAEQKIHPLSAKLNYGILFRVN